MASLVPPVILKATTRHTATMIFLHGLGDTGVGWAGALNTIKPKYMKVICPTAPMIPVSLNGGMQMPAWYDILSLDPLDKNREDLEGVDIASKNLRGLIEAEVSQSKIPKTQIMIGGFSQGGAVAVHAMLREEPLAGCVALSTYLPGKIEDYENNPEKLSQDCPTKVLQCHGEVDEMVPYIRGTQSRDILQKYLKDKIDFHSFPNMGHEGIPEELDLVRKFIETQTAQDF